MGSEMCIRDRLNIIPTLYEGYYIVLMHRMVVENRPVDPDSIQGSHRPISFMIKHGTRADDILCKTECYSVIIISYV